MRRIGVPLIMRRISPVPAFGHFGFLLALLVSVGGCARTDIPMQGLIEGFSSDQTKVFIAHDEVEGFMPAMTMPFNADPATIEGYEIGDAVSFVLHVRKNRSFVSGLQRIPRSQLRHAGDAGENDARTLTVRGDSSISVLRIGDTLGAVQLIDQKGEGFVLPDTSARAILVDFIYTRCPLPDFCPLLSTRFREVHRSAPNDVRLVSVTIDPEYDTPSVLEGYAKRYGADYPRWRFATGTPNTLAALYVAAGVTIFTDSETLDHNLATILLDGTGSVIRIWRDTDATVDEMMEELALVE